MDNATTRNCGIAGGPPTGGGTVSEEAFMVELFIGALAASGFFFVLRFAGSRGLPHQVWGSGRRALEPGWRVWERPWACPGW